MKNLNTVKVLVILALSIATAIRADASQLLRAHERNLRIAQNVEKQEHLRYQEAKNSYKTSKNRTNSLEARIKRVRKDELKEDQQLRAIEKANARYYEIPQYRLETANSGLTYNGGQK